MDIVEMFIRVIGSKWFVLLLGIGMCFAVPPTWHAVVVKPTGVDIAIFIMAVLTACLAFYKFFNMVLAQRRQPQVENREW